MRTIVPCEELPPAEEPYLVCRVPPIRVQEPTERIAWLGAFSISRLICVR